MVMFLWKEKFELGIKEIDMQHRKLFTIGNKLYKTSYQDAKPLILELFNYTRTHFSTEEEYMKSQNYQGLDSHKFVHEDLLKKLGEVTKSGVNSANDYDKLLEFMDEWLRVHIMYEDMKYLS